MSTIGLIGIVLSKNKIPIRLTQERWDHITTAHPEIDRSESSLVIKTIEKPDIILKGDKDELLALRKKFGKKTWLVVVYKEVKGSDGFILTAYITTDNKWLFKRKIIWNRI